ncbi:hypothetical protein TBLA_0G01980 [Henningerozyma blattae CBS 6284]|uniref:GST C-terminal domain-containing protein n=1 Tax=Henningerozyma blattae (strain ATCC 34711 / CBS 6284 / DSM 70876 / NBRC 10599 / NRRL Y-10934 / UCD 77-7) TaxID=1071380 RepID=I2H6Y8_HENB6|nr:hypothetical protein TBLA_0G01980 [Tetrapisispora blattae CBS 6284]CCH62140.1 hypothetical protein TBLA_0G01980 [Tetrapisispora blattae CBS 6284]
MSQGTLFVNDFPRGIVAKRLVEFYNLDVKIESTSSPTFIKEFPLKRIPVFITSDGVKLQEMTPLSIYLANFISDKKVKAQLLSEGNILDQALQGKWMSLSNTDFFTCAANIFYMSVGNWQYYEELDEKFWKEVNAAASVFEERLSKNNYLVNDNITLADLITGVQWAFSFQHILGEEFRSKYPSIEPWVRRVIGEPILKEQFKDFKLLEKNCDSKFH